MKSCIGVSSVYKTLATITEVLFDEDDIMFKRTNEAWFDDFDNELQDRFDSCTKSDDVTIDLFGGEANQ
ncbi:unnamed protein product [Mucor hiemalis]